MCLSYLYSPPSTRTPILFPLPNFVSSLLFSKPIDYNQCCPHVHGCGHPHCLDSLTMGDTAEENPFSQQSLSASGISARREVSRCLCWNIDWLGLVQVLCRQLQMQRVHGCSGPVLTRKHCIPAVLYEIWSLQLPPTSSMTVPEHW